MPPSSLSDAAAVSTKATPASPAQSTIDVPGLGDIGELPGQWEVECQRGGEGVLEASHRRGKLIITSWLAVRTNLD